MEVKGRIWIKNRNINFLGHGKIELLEKIQKLGSISKAAKEMKMSYKAAWDSIDMMNKASNEPLVMRSTGGRGGGGTQVTKKGKEAIKIFRGLEEAQEKLLHFFQADLDSWQEASQNTLDNSLKDAKSYVIKTSARNQFFGNILTIEKDDLSAKVTIELTDKIKIISKITLDSLKELNLMPEMNCFALIKANWVFVSKNEPSKEQAKSYENLYVGKVLSTKENKENVQLEIDCDGIIFCANIQKKSQHEGFKEKEKLYFGFESSNVILGI